MVLLSLILRISLLCSLHINSLSRHGAFIKLWNPGSPSIKYQLHNTDEGMSNIPLDLEDRQNFLDDGLDVESEATPREPVSSTTESNMTTQMDLTVNTVTLCGRIGHITQPFIFESGTKCLRISLATSERIRDGSVKTEWHRVVIYGNKNVDYVYSRASVGDRALAIGNLRYYIPNSIDDFTQQPSRIKIPEISVSTLRGGHKFILLQRPFRNGHFNDNDRID